MSYIVTTAQAGEATYEDYVEPDGVLQGPPAAVSETLTTYMVYIHMTVCNMDAISVLQHSTALHPTPTRSTDYTAARCRVQHSAAYGKLTTHHTILLLP